MKDYLLLLIADLLLAANFAFNKIYQRRAGTAFSAGFTFSALCGAFTAIVFWIYNGFKFAITPFSVLMAVLQSLLCTAYLLIGFRIIKRQGVSLYTLFLMTGGMTVPYIFGLAFLNETFSVLRLIGLAVIIAGVFLTGFGKEKIDKSSMLLCVAIFFLNGGVSVVSKLHSINTELSVTPEAFVVLSGVVSCVVSTALRFTVRDGNSVDEKSVQPRLSAFLLTFILIPALSALAGGVSSVLQLTGAQTIDASLLYPFITGGSIVFTTLAGWLIFREKLTRNTWIGIACAFVGTMLFLEF